MAYEVGVRREGVVACRLCSKDVVETTHERIADVCGLPVGRSIRRGWECPCGSWQSTKVRDATFPRTPGVVREIVVSWVLILGLAACFIPAILWEHGRDDARARAPEVGDRWTLRHENEYYVARVDAVTASEITFSECDWKATTEEKAEDTCDRFPRKAEPVPRALVERLDIRDIRRDGDIRKSIAMVAPWLLLVGALLAWHAHRARRAFG